MTVKQTTCNKMKINHLAGVAVVVLAATQVHAVPITGNIGFTGQLTVNSSSPGTATQITSWINPQVNGDSGVFGSGVFAIATGTPVVMTSSSWNLNTSTPIPNFWSVGGFTFELLSSVIFAQGGSSGQNSFVAVDGTGLVTGNGYTPTVMSFNLSTSDPFAGSGPTTWTFQASGASTLPSVADGSSTAMLLGLALTGVAWIKRKTAG
jgi:hypothetical protein